MNGACNQISLNEAALFRDLKAEAREALRIEGERLLQHMRREVQRTTNGGAPGKPEWRDEVRTNLDFVAAADSGDSISMDFGYSPSDQADLVRAMIVEAGSGSAAGGAPIHAGPEGRSVWDGDVQGRHPSQAKSEYPLPDGFNQKGNRFAENAMRLMRTEFGELAEVLFSNVPDSVFYGNVQVSSR